MNHPSSNAAVKIDSLERILAAKNNKELAESSLSAYREIAVGDHFSAILINLPALEVENYFLNDSWLAGRSHFWGEARSGLRSHQLANCDLSQQRSLFLHRSRLVADAAWKETWIYNEVERDLGVEDTVSICLITHSNHLLILTSGRDLKFSDREIRPIQQFQRILVSLTPFQTNSTGGPSNPMERRPAENGGLSTLTRRETEVLHWVREGKRDPEIAVILGISTRTVNHHIENILRKLCVETRTAAARFQ